MAITASFSSATDTLTLIGSTSADPMIVSRAAAGALLVNGGSVPISGGTPTVANTDLIEAFGDDGNDSIALNEASGAVRSSVSFVMAGSDLERLDGDNVLNGGRGADRLVGLAGNDTFVVDNAGDEAIEAKDGGIDTVRSSVSFDMGGSHLENLVLTGTGNIGGDGNSLANILSGNNGNNVLDGGSGADRLVGRAGRDSFVFSSALDAAANVDRIADFTVADDTIRLENAVFTTLAVIGTLAAGRFFIGSAAHDASDRIIYNSANGALFYDADGNGAGAAIRFATVSTGLAMTNADFVVI